MLPDLTNFQWLSDNVGISEIPGSKPLAWRVVERVSTWRGQMLYIESQELYSTPEAARIAAMRREPCKPTVTARAEQFRIAVTELMRDYKLYNSTICAKGFENAVVDAATRLLLNAKCYCYC